MKLARKVDMIDHLESIYKPIDHENPFVLERR